MQEGMRMKKRTFKVVAHFHKGKLIFADQDVVEPMDSSTTVYHYGPSEVAPATLTLFPGEQEEEDVSARKCKDCRWWAGRAEHWTPTTAVCERIHAGAGKRDDTARIFPVTSGAYLETDADFSCSLAEKP